MVYIRVPKHVIPITVVPTFPHPPILPENGGLQLKAVLKRRDIYTENINCLTDRQP